jgi:hypothetical protein
MESLNLIGPIERLQIQRERLVIGTRPNRVYRPDPLTAVDSMVLSPDGPLAKINDGWVVAVHHAAHPANPMPNLDRMLSVGFTSHYAAMAARFGAAPIGIAGENIIVAADRMITSSDLAGGLVIERPDGARIELKGAAVAEPCVPFTRYLLNDQEADLELVTPNRDFLRNGMRGFVMATAGLAESVEISVGDLVYSRSS